MIPLHCACGTVRGELDLGPGGRVVCYCDDCQAWLRFLGREDLADAWGGTDVWQTTPRRVRVTAGADALRVLRLGPGGLTRCYASCCRTPTWNMLGPRMPFLGLLAAFTDHAAAGGTRDAQLGPPSFIQGRFAKGGCPPHAEPRAGAGIVLGSAWRILVAAFHGEHRPSPLWDEAGKERFSVQVLTPAERAALG